MKIDSVEFSSSLSQNMDANKVIFNLLESMSIARTVLINDKLKEDENPNISIGRGTRVWQISPLGHPVSMIHAASKTSRKTKIPLHTFQMFSPPVDPEVSKDVEGAAHHLLGCETLAFLSLASNMIGDDWDESVSSKSEIPNVIGSGVKNISGKGMLPSALICDKLTFDSMIRRMESFSSEMTHVNGVPTFMSSITVMDKKIRIFMCDSPIQDDGFIFICSQMMGLLSQCGDVNFWENGKKGVFSIRESMSLMSRNSIFAIKKE